MERVWKVLVVDDDKDFIEIIRLSLESRGYRVICARNGKEGWKMLKKEKPDVVILDLMMERLDSGMALSRKIKNHPEYGAIPILMLTSMSRETGLDFSPRSRKDLDQLHVDDFCTKPIKMKILWEKLERLLQARPSEMGK